MFTQEWNVGYFKNLYKIKFCLQKRSIGSLADPVGSGGEGGGGRAKPPTGAEGTEKICPNIPPLVNRHFDNYGGYKVPISPDNTIMDPKGIAGEG